MTGKSIFKTIILGLFLVFNHLCFGQVEVKGRVLDSATHKPVPYCNVYFSESETGTVTDEKGYFYLANRKGGELNISNVVYAGKRLQINKNTNLGNIYLTSKIIELKPISIKPLKCKTIKSGIYEKSRRKPYRFSFWGRGAGDRVALHIENPCKSNETATIKSLFYYIIDPTDTGYVFRIQVYDANGKILRLPNAPGNALIPENITMRKPKTNGWIEVDVSKYNIQVPAGGIYIAIEFLQDSPYAKERSSSVSLPVMAYDTVKMKNDVEKLLQSNSNNGETIVFSETRKLSKKEAEEIKKSADEREKSLIRVLYSTYDNKKLREVFSLGGRWIYTSTHPGLVIENPCIYATFDICK